MSTEFANGWWTVDGRKSMDPNELSYRIFIVRCWAEETPDDAVKVVRYSLDVAATGERLGFVDAKELLEALEAELIHIEQVQPLSEG